MFWKPEAYKVSDRSSSTAVRTYGGGPFEIQLEPISKQNGAMLTHNRIQAPEGLTSEDSGIDRSQCK